MENIRNVNVDAVEEQIYWFQGQIAKNENRIKYAQLSDNEAAMLRSDIREHENEIRELKLLLMAI